MDKLKSMEDFQDRFCFLNGGVLYRPGAHPCDQHRSHGTFRSCYDFYAEANKEIQDKILKNYYVFTNRREWTEKG